MKKSTLAAILASSAVLFGAWELLARAIASPLILPAASSVLRDSGRLFLEQAFLADVAYTFARGLAAFAVSFALSAALGALAGTRPLFSAALSPWMSVIKSTPVVSFILIAILWFGSDIMPIFVAVLMTLPVMTEACAQGARSCDPRLLEMARVFAIPRRKVLFAIRIPSAMPYVLAGAGASLGLTWKVVVAGEILGFPRSGLGSAMQTAKVHLETTRVFSLTLVAIALSVITELSFRAIARAASRRAIPETRRKGDKE